MAQASLQELFKRRRGRRHQARVGVGSRIDKNQRLFGVVLFKSGNQLPIKRILPFRLPHPQATAAHQQRDNKQREN